MEAKKDPKRVKKMFAEGEVSMVDPVTMYRYSLTARCPKDGENAFVERYERSGHSLRSVTFKCPVCSTQFEVPQAQIMVI